jgi:LMBR1 domain-containing protein 1
LVIVSITFIMGVIIWRHFSHPGIKCVQKIADLSNLEFIELKTTSKISKTLKTKDIEIKYKPNFIMIIIFFILLIGWFLFVIFGGVGLVALPMDMILDFLYR